MMSYSRQYCSEASRKIFSVLISPLRSFPRSSRYPCALLAPWHSSSRRLKAWSNYGLLKGGTLTLVTCYPAILFAPLQRRHDPNTLPAPKSPYVVDEKQLLAHDNHSCRGVFTHENRGVLSFDSRTLLGIIAYPGREGRQPAGNQDRPQDRASACCDPRFFPVLEL